MGWPFTSLMPKISDEGKEVETLTLRLGEVLGLSTSSSAYTRMGSMHALDLALDIKGTDFGFGDGSSTIC